MTKKTKIEKVLNLFETGKTFTATQITKRTGAKSPTSVIRYLRNYGHDIRLVRGARPNPPHNAYQLA